MHTTFWDENEKNNQIFTFSEFLKNQMKVLL